MTDSPTPSAPDPAAWVRLPDDLDATNDTDAARTLGGFVRSSVWWQPSTGRVVGRLYRRPA